MHPIILTVLSLPTAQVIFRSDVSGREQKQGLRVAVALISHISHLKGPVHSVAHRSLYVVVLALYEDFTH